MLPPERAGKKGRPRNDNRKMLNGMLWMNHSGAQWRQLPQCYGPWQSVYARFAKWQDDGLWEKIFTVLSQEADTENLRAYPQISRCGKMTTKGGGKMEKKSSKSWTISDALWEAIKDEIPERQRAEGKAYKRKPGGGRKPLPKRWVLEGIFYV